MIELVASFPDSKLMPNRKHGRHWGGTRDLKFDAHEEGFYLSKQAKVSLENKKTPVKLIFHCRDRRRRDLDNLLASCKSLLDGVASGLSIDDRYFRPITIDFGEVDKMKPRVEIYIDNEQ